MTLLVKLWSSHEAEKPHIPPNYEFVKLVDYLRVSFARLTCMDPVIKTLLKTECY